MLPVVCLHFLGSLYVSTTHAHVDAKPAQIYRVLIWVELKALCKKLRAKLPATHRARHQCQMLAYIDAVRIKVWMLSEVLVGALVQVICDILLECHLLLAFLAFLQPQGTHIKAQVFCARFHVVLLYTKQIRQRG